MIFAAETVTPGGPSAPAWAFFTAITLAVLTIIGQQLKAHSDIRQLRIKAEETKVEVAKAVENSAPVSNGFAKGVKESQAQILEKLDDMDESIRKHLEWHLNQRGH